MMSEYSIDFCSMKSPPKPFRKSWYSPPMAKPRITDPVELIQYAPERGAVALSSDRPVVSKRSLTGFGDHHPNDGNPPRSGTYRSRLDRGAIAARRTMKVP
jgi:hypothetical protein